MATREVARVGDEDDGRARGFFEEVAKAPRDLAAKNLGGSLVDVAYCDEGVRGIDKGAELGER